MEEPQVGITEYTTTTSGFRGILKHRYEDFLVFEVDGKGRTAHLTTLEPPEPVEPVPNAQLTTESVTELAAAFKEIAGQKNADRLSALLHNIRNHQQQQIQQIQQKQQQPGKAKQQQGTSSASPAQQAVGSGADGPAAAAAAAGTSTAADADAAGADEEQQLMAYLLPIKDKETRKAVHNFLKTDPRLPPLETDTVSSIADAAAEAVAAEAAVDEAAAQAKLPSYLRKKRMTWETDEMVAKQKKKEDEALTIIRVRFLEDTTGLGAKRGAQKQNIMAKEQKKDHRKKHRGWRFEAWPGGDDKFVKFVLLKENMDTQAALTVISRMLRLHSQAFGFAGTKDRRGVTTQYVTLFKVDPSKLSGLNQRLRGIKLGNFEFCSSHLQLGQLRGNTFRILMRDVDKQDEAHIASAVAEVRTKGFINYFGLQRFGTGNIPTHRIGAALLRGEWQAAVELILQGTDNDKDDVRAARDKYVKAGDIKGALDGMPSWMVAERAILQVLLKQGPTAYTAALQAVPRTLRSMYMHAWQSWCWNTAASERIRRYGADRVIAGDLVLPPNSTAAAAGELEERGNAGAAAAAAAGQAAAAADGEAGVAAMDADAAADDDLASASSRLAAVHMVTEEEAEQGLFSITDVVLPLPGGQVQYPQHAAGWELYCRLGAADGILLPQETAEEYAAAVAAAAAAAGGGDADAAAAAAAAAGGGGGDDAAAAGAVAAAAGAAAVGATTVPRQHGVKEFQLSGLSGDYRKVLHVPSGLQHRVVRYVDPNQSDILPNDLTELQAQKRQQKQEKRQEKKRGRETAGNEQQQQQREGDEEGQQQGDEGQQEGQQQNGNASKRQRLDAQPQQGEQRHQQEEKEQVKQDGSVTQPMEVEQEQQPDSDSNAPVHTPAAAAAATAANGDAAPKAEMSEGGHAAAAAAAAAAAGGGGSAERERVGVILEFFLPSSCYATMLMRELTKTSTSKAAHKSLSTKQPADAGGAGVA